LICVKKSRKSTKSVLWKRVLSKSAVMSICPKRFVSCYPSMVRWWRALTWFFLLYNTWVGYYLQLG
jgi:hypothetical protein